MTVASLLVLIAKLSCRDIEESVAEQVFAGSAAVRYVSKALRTRAWRSLRSESRALLLALRKWKGGLKPKACLKTLLKTCQR